MSDKLPWFPFFVNDWLLDDKVRRMGFTERGIYLHLLCLQWLDGSIPAQLGDLKPTLAMTPSDQVSDALLQSVVERCFPVCEGQPTIRRNPRLAQILQDQEVIREKQRQGGLKGGLRSAQAKLKPSSSKAEPEPKTEPEEAKTKTVPAHAGRGNGHGPKVTLRETWLSPFLVAHLTHSGAIAEGELAKAVAPVRSALGDAKALKAFLAFLTTPNAARFGVHYFAKHFRDYEPVPLLDADGNPDLIALARAGVLP